MNKPLLIPIAIIAIDAHAASIYEQAACKNTKPGNEIEIHANNRIYHLDQKKENCNENYSFIDSGDGSMIILADPDADELGINAQNEIYFATHGSNEAINIGSIPARSDFIANKTFRDIAQFGGTIFQTIYKIKDGKLAIAQPSYELIFADEQCIYSNKESKKCLTLKGTYEKPICTIQLGERKILTKKEQCTALRKEINSRLGK